MSDELGNRKRKSRKDSRKEKTKTGAEKRITTKKATKDGNTGQTESDDAKRGRKIRRGKKWQKERKLEYSIYKSCVLKIFVNEVFQRIGQEASLITVGKKSSKETTAKIKQAVRLLCRVQLGKSSDSKGAQMAAIDGVNE